MEDGSLPKTFRNSVHFYFRVSSCGRGCPTLVAVVFFVGKGELLIVSRESDDNDEAFQNDGLLTLAVPGSVHA